MKRSLLSFRLTNAESNELGKEVLACQKLISEPDLGFVGEINSVRTESIEEALSQGLMPILSSTASDEDGQCYNANADTAAAKIAIAL